MARIFASTFCGQPTTLEISGCSAENFIAEPSSGQFAQSGPSCICNSARTSVCRWPSISAKLCTRAAINPSQPALKQARGMSCHCSGHGLHHSVKGGAFLIGGLGAKTGNRAVNQTWIVFCQPVGPKSAPCQRSRFSGFQVFRFSMKISALCNN